MGLNHKSEFWIWETYMTQIFWFSLFLTRLISFWILGWVISLYCENTFITFEKILTAVYRNERIGLFSTVKLIVYNYIIDLALNGSFALPSVVLWTTCTKINKGLLTKPVCTERVLPIHTLRSCFCWKRSLFQEISNLMHNCNCLIIT